MIKYNFAKNYKRISLWYYKVDPKKTNPSKIKNLSILNKFAIYIPKLEYLINFSKRNKILFIPSFSILSLTLLIQLISIVPIAKIKSLENYHYDYEDNANLLSDINRSLESEFNSFIKYANLYAISTPAYLFGYYLQSLIPAGVQLSDYTVDNYGFKINAIGDNIISINKLLNLLLDNKLVESDSLKLARLIDQSESSTDSLEGNQIQAGMFVEITGRLSKSSLKTIIELNKNAFNYGTLSKLNKYSYILNLFTK